MKTLNVVSFYRFVDVADPPTLRRRLEARCHESRLVGTLLVAAEGVNGTLAGDGDAIRAVLRWLRQALSLDRDIDSRWAEATEAPFRRMRVKVKKEIVALGRVDVRPQDATGRHVSPAEWNDLIADPKTVLIDTRNRYEVELGSFPNALDPETDCFREFAQFARRLADADRDNRHRPVAMFCTGGIRCEKAAALMLALGFEDVSQLDGGILNYLQTVAPEDSQWQGECFVFDTRVAVDRDLAEGGYVQCHACRRPLSGDDLASADYREGVSCPKCIDTLEPARAERLEERRRQVQLARARGEAHIGARQSGSKA